MIGSLISIILCLLGFVKFLAFAHSVYMIIYDFWPFSFVEELSDVFLLKNLWAIFMWFI